MKQLYSSPALAVLMLWALAPAHGAPKAKSDSPSTRAQAILGSIDAQSASIADTAYQLERLAKDLHPPEAHLDGIDALRAEVNTIGSELQSLEAERDSLAEWEVQALDQILPLMHDVADNTDKAIQTYRSDRGRLWVTPYVGDTARVVQDANEVSTLLRDYLKLAKTREKEARIEQSLGESPQF